MKVPHRISPMLCTLVKEPFDRTGWIFETKWDGYRALAEIDGTHILLYSRNQKSFNQDYPEIITALKRLNMRSAILDGELIVVNAAGRQCFQGMQNYKRLRQGKVMYCIFDLLYLNGKDLRHFPLIERKRLLKKLMTNLRNKHLKYTPSIKSKGIAFFKKAQKEHLEGIIAKDAQSPYRMKRSSEWVKIKTGQRQEVVIGGFTPPKGSRKKIGALLVGVYKQGKLTFVGKVGGGFSPATLTAVWKQLLPLKQTNNPFSTSIDLPSVTWVKPTLVCEVSFAEWTADDKLRQPVFRGMRVDKVATRVHRERARRGQ